MGARAREKTGAKLFLELTPEHLHESNPRIKFLLQVSCFLNFAGSLEQEFNLFLFRMFHSLRRDEKFSQDTHLYFFCTNKKLID